MSRMNVSGPALAAVSLLLCSVAIPTNAAQPITVVAGGKSPYVIVIPDDADAGRIAQASGLLRSAVAEATGLTLPVVKESALKAGTPAIYLGKSRAARRAGLDVDKVKGWAYLHRVVGRDIFLVGDDGQDPVEGKGMIEHLGTLKAVVAFLEDQVGARFFLPGKHGKYIPRLETITVDAGLNKSWKPRFDYVVGRAPRDRFYAVALNLFRRSPVLYTYGGHSYYTAVPAKKYGKTNPEYFALLGGKRTPDGNHLCISNPDVQELMLKEMELRLDAGFQWVELAQTDGYRPCHCEACKAIHPDPGERTWIVHRQLAEKMLKRRPGKKVTLIAYPPTRQPPKTFRSFPENVIVQLTAYSPEAFDAWEPYQVDKCVYIYNWGQYLTPGYGPKRTPRYAVEQIRMFLKNRVRGIYICGGFSGGQGSFGIEGPSYYAYGKALDDPSRDPDDILREYADAAFGKAAVPMYAFFKAMHDRLEAFSIFNRPYAYAMKVPTTFRAPEDFYCHFFPPNLVDDMRRNLERAKNAAETDRVKANLRLVEIEFKYVANLASIFQHYRAYRAAPSRKALELLGEQVKAREALIDGFFPKGRPTRIEGLVPPFIGAPKAWVKAGGRLSATLTAPMNWDFALLLEHGLLPGVGSKKLEVGRVSAIRLDGRLDEPAWQKAAFHEMSEISMGAVKNATRFKVGYDAKNFYLGFVCEFDKVEPIEAVKAVGRDGAAWAQECVEVMIDPYGKRERHCQFIINPAPDSTYDARYAYIEDPLHPLYGKRDSSWHGKWDYVVDKAKKQWTVEVRIPYTTLETTPPRPGSNWTMNAGRAEYPRGYKGGPVYSIWAPNLEARSFHDRSTFGDVVFK